MSKKSETLRTEIPDLPEVAELSEEQLRAVAGGRRKVNKVETPHEDPRVTQILATHRKWSNWTRGW